MAVPAKFLRHHAHADFVVIDPGQGLIVVGLRDELASLKRLYREWLHQMAHRHWLVLTDRSGQLKANSTS
jgi:hypothetical protein